MSVARVFAVLVLGAGIAVGVGGCELGSGAKKAPGLAIEPLEFRQLSGDPRVGQLIVLQLTNKTDPNTKRVVISSAHDPFVMYAGKNRNDANEKIVFKFVNLTFENLKIKLQTPTVGVDPILSPFPQKSYELLVPFNPFDLGKTHELVTEVRSDFEQYLGKLGNWPRAKEFTYIFEIYDEDNVRRGEIDPEIILEGRP